jgi:hypothetical protein
MVSCSFDYCHCPWICSLKLVKIQNTAFSPNIFGLNRYLHDRETCIFKFVSTTCMHFFILRVAIFLASSHLLLWWVEETTQLVFVKMLLSQDTHEHLCPCLDLTCWYVCDYPSRHGHMVWISLRRPCNTLLGFIQISGNDLHLFACVCTLYWFCILLDMK